VGFDQYPEEVRHSKNGEVGGDIQRGGKKKSRTKKRGIRGGKAAPLARRR